MMNLTETYEILGLFRLTKRGTLYLAPLECEMVNHSMIGATIGTRLFAMLVFRSCNIKLLGCLALLMIGHRLAYAKDWRSIVPLHTTRTAVEKRLGPPTMYRGDTVVYDFENERALIEYSKGPCSLKFSQWNVARDTVISVWVTPKTDLNAKDLGLDKNYKTVRDEHRPEIIHYIDEQVGIEYNVYERSGIVGLIKYLPSTADKNLRCRARANNVMKRARPKKSLRFSSFRYVRVLTVAPTSVLSKSTAWIRPSDTLI